SAAPTAARTPARPHPRTPAARLDQARSHVAVDSCYSHPLGTTLTIRASCPSAPTSFPPRGVGADDESPRGRWGEGSPEQPTRWAYDRKSSSFGRLDKGLDEARTKGWTIVDMKNDWETIFAYEQTRM